MRIDKKFKKGVCNIPTEDFRVFGFTISEIGRQKLAQLETSDLYDKVKELGIKECFIVSSCNRVQFYYFSEEDKSRELSETINPRNQNSLYSRATKFSGSFAVRYFLESSVGMHSFVIADSGINEQFTRSMNQSAENGMMGMHLKRLKKKMVELKAQDFMEGFKAPTEGNQAVYELETSYDVIKPEKILVIGTGAVAKATIEAIRNSDNENIRNSDILVASKDQNRLYNFLSRNKLSREDGIIYLDETIQIPEEVSIIIKANTTNALRGFNPEQATLVFELTTPKEKQISDSRNIILHDLESIQAGLLERNEVRDFLGRKESVSLEIGKFARKHFYPDNSKILTKQAVSMFNAEPCGVFMR
jgi:glutamyl-tRNA reductase